MPYDPQPTQYLFPKKTDQHYLPLKYQKNIVFDENYPYVDKSFGHRLISGFMRFLTVIAAFPLMRIRCLLKVKGRKNIRTCTTQMMTEIQIFLDAISISLLQRFAQANLKK